jgi:hypothetical protein
MLNDEWITSEEKRRKFVEDYHALLSPYVKEKKQLSLYWERDSKTPILCLDWYDQNIPIPLLEHIHQLIKGL